MQPPFARDPRRHTLPLLADCPVQDTEVVDRADVYRLLAYAEIPGDAWAILPRLSSRSNPDAYEPLNRRSHVK
jgi:hypothetical protein